MSQPRLPLPPLLMTSDPSSFIQHTLDHRWTTIARRVAAENAVSPATVRDLDALIHDLAEGTVRPLRADGGADLADWARYVEPFLGRSWRDLPWYFAEAYFYRRILEATRYFASGSGRVDPFAKQKRAGLAAATDWRAIVLSLSASGRQAEPDTAPEARRSMLAAGLSANLWGNQADLSLRPTADAAPVQSDRFAAQDERVLVDNTAAVVDRLMAGAAERVDWIADNAGTELISDLVLIDLVLSFSLAQTVQLHLKPHPTFVSDATIEDVEETIATLAADDEIDAARTLAARLREYLAADRLRLRTHAFWTSPLAFWEMSAALHQDLAQAALVLIKGDANYRRLLGDRRWRSVTPLAEIACYFPAPLAALRTLKSEIVVGLEPGQAERIRQRDADWLTNGQWGVIQFVDPAIA